MRVFLTGATGFIGSHLVPELIAADHQVIGLSRSDAGAKALARAGAEVCRGDVNDLDSLRAAAGAADAVVHAAFNHDFSNLKQHSEQDRKVIETLGEALAGSDRPLVVTSGTGLARSKTGGPALETDDHVTSAEFPRAATEEAADALIAKGGRVMVMRLSQVHDTRHQGRITQHILLARQKGWVAYVGEGKNRLAAVHVSDAVRLYRLALEKGQAGARYNAVSEEGVVLRDIAEVIGAGLKMAVRSITPAAASEYFGPLANLVTIDLAASSALTRQQLGWNPTGPDLLTDLRDLEHGHTGAERRHHRAVAGVGDLAGKPRGRRTPHR
jgi:nucleoside-diphosphate-sugar epimerase